MGRREERDLNPHRVLALGTGQMDNNNLSRPFPLPIKSVEDKGKSHDFETLSFHLMSGNFPAVLQYLKTT